MFNHVRRWNIWRKKCLNGPIYKILVLFGVTKSPTMAFVSLPEEEEVAKTFAEGFRKGIEEGERLFIEKHYTTNQTREILGLEPIKDDGRIMTSHFAGKEKNDD